MTLPFNPSYGSGATRTAVTTSAYYPIRSGTRSVCVTNTGATNAAYVRIGQGTSLTATAADYIIMPGSQVSLGKFEDDNVIAIVSSAGSTTLHIISGAGL
jgi:hypothetical protein